MVLIDLIIRHFNIDAEPEKSVGYSNTNKHKSQPLPLITDQYASTAVNHEYLTYSKEQFEGAYLDAGAVKNVCDKRQALAYCHASGRHFKLLPSSASFCFGCVVH